MKKQSIWLCEGGKKSNNIFLYLNQMIKLDSLEIKFKKKKHTKQTGRI